MFSVRTETLARTIAREKGLMFGWSVFGGYWYVGTDSQLRAIGVIDPKAP